MVRQHVETQRSTPGEGAYALPDDKLQMPDGTDQDVAAILGLAETAFDDIPVEAVFVEAPRKSGGFMLWKISTACAMILAALIGAPMVWRHVRDSGHPELQTPMIAAVALSGNNAPPTPSAEEIIPDRSQNLDLRLQKQPRPTLARAASSRSHTGRMDEDSRQKRVSSGSSDRTSFDVASTSSPRRAFDPRRSKPEQASEMRGFIDAKVDPDRLARAERLEALDAIRLLRQK